MTLGGGAERPPTKRVPGFPMLKDLLRRRYEKSVLRRTALLCAFLVPAYGANFLTYYVTGRLLPAESFGVFFVGNTVENVLFTGAFILNILFTRHLVSVLETQGAAMAVVALGGIERKVVGWGALGAVATCLALPLVAKALALKAPLVAVAVVLECYASYLADIARAYLQSVRRTVRLGQYTLAWMILRLLLCVLGILAFRTVWGAFAGMALAAGIMFLGFHLSIGRPVGAAAAATPSFPSALALAPLFCGYALVIIIFNLDILLSFFVVTGDGLGVYSASSVFPKAILMVTAAPLQMVFAMMVAGYVARGGFDLVAQKAGVAALALAVAGVGTVWLASGWVCGGRWGLNLCERSALGILLLSVIPLSLLRVLVLVEFARNRDWRALLLAVPALLYVIFAGLSARQVTVLASSFSIFAWATLVYFLCIYLVPGGRRVASGPDRNGRQAK